MLNRLFITLTIAGTVLVSCKKSNNTPKQQIPLYNAIDGKYIHLGNDDNTYVVEYSTFNAKADIDKKVWDAALQTVQGSFNVKSVTVNGATLIMEFDRDSNVMPSKLHLTGGSALDKAVNQPWPWKGILNIHKQNTLLTSQQFDADISVQVSAVNTGDVAEITSRVINGDNMGVEYELSKFNPQYSEAVSFQVQASTPITLTPQFEISCLIPGFYDPQTNVIVDYAKSIKPPAQTNLGNNTTSYNQEVYASWANQSLSESIALQYFVKDVYPLVK